MKTKKLYYWSFIVSLAGFLFGFDTIVISGAEQNIQQLWGTYTLFGRNDLFHGIIIVGSALWGTVLGAVLGAIPNDKYGRKNTLFLIGLLYAISAIGSSLAVNPWVFGIFRFIGGLGVGASTIAAPSYISEIAPQEKRGSLVAAYQFNIVFGILIAFISNALLAKFLGDKAWRWMIGIEAFPAVFYTLLVWIIPKSPRWLISKNNDIEGAKSIFSMLYHNKDTIEKQVALIVASNKKVYDRESIFSKKYHITLSLAFFISFFNQFSGINAILYYANRIFAVAGLEEQAGSLGTIGLGITNFIFTLLGMFLIDRLGRKVLLYIGSIGYIISLTLVSLCFFNDWSGLIVPISLFLFIASHAVGQGAVIWVFISEIFPNHLRSKGQSFGCSVHWLLAAIIPSLVPSLFNSIGAGVVFAIFAFMMLLQLIWVKFYVPETKGRTLEELSVSLMKDYD